MKKARIKKITVTIIMVFAMICGLYIPAFSAETDDGIVFTTSYNPFANTSNGNWRSIIGSDDRVNISNTDDYPYSAISYLEIEYGCNKHSRQGTGFMVSENCMITAGHCLVCEKDGAEATSVTAWFGYKSATDYLLKITVTSQNSDLHLYHDPNYTGTETNYDYGYVVFNSDVGDTTGWLGLAAINDSSLDGLPIHVTGYDGLVLKDCAGEITSVASTRVKYDADTYSGQSGSPVYLNEANHGYVVLAIHTNGIDLFNWKNSGWRITSDFIDVLADLGYVTKVS